MKDWLLAQLKSFSCDTLASLLHSLFLFEVRNRYFHQLQFAIGHKP